MAYTPPSSSGQGYKVFNLETGVQFSVGVLTICQSGNGVVCKTTFAGSIPDVVLCGGGVMAAASDLKSDGSYIPCGFESHPPYYALIAQLDRATAF